MRSTPITNSQPIEMIQLFQGLNGYLFPSIVVDLDDAWRQGVLAVLARTGDPVLLVRRDVDVVRLVTTATERGEFQITVGPVFDKRTRPIRPGARPRWRYMIRVFTADIREA